MENRSLCCHETLLLTERGRVTCLEVMGARENGARKGDMRVSVMRLVRTCAHFFQVPAMPQARGGAWLHEETRKVMDRRMRFSSHGISPIVSGSQGKS